MVELRGIVINHKDPVREIKLLIRGERGDDYKYFIFPSTLPLNRGQILKFLGNHFNIPPGEIAWPPHVKIPGE